MNLTSLQTRLKNDLAWLGAFNSSSGSSRLNSAILSSALKIWNKHPWPWKYTSTTISTTSGTKGPYSAPTGFEGFAAEQKVNRFGIDTRLGDLYTTHIIKPTDNDSWDIYYNEIEDALYFAEDPGNNSLTLGYEQTFDNDIDNIEATLVVFTENLYNAFEKLVTSNLLDNVDTKNESRAYESEGFAYVDKQYENFRRGVRKPKQIVSRDYFNRPHDGVGNPEVIHPFYGTQGV